MRPMLVGLALLVLTACTPPRYVEVVAVDRPQPWYEACTWDYPCDYPNDVVFVYGWGYFPRMRYRLYMTHPEFRRDLRRTNERPPYRPRNREWSHHEPEHREPRHEARPENGRTRRDRPQHRPDRRDGQQHGRRH